MKPQNLPDGWEYQEVGHTVTCGGCCFRFGAEHPNSVVIGPDTWTCPSCGDGNRFEDHDRKARRAAPELHAILCELVNPDDFDQHPQDFAEPWHRARAIISKAEGFAP